MKNTVGGNEKGGKGEKKVSENGKREKTEYSDEVRKNWRRGRRREEGKEKEKCWR